MRLFPSRSSSPLTITAAPAQPRRRGGGIRRWLIPALGAVTPVALIVVNIAVFIAKHLDAFRWTVAILAFVSGMLLNSWTGLKIYRVIQHRFRQSFLVSELNQDLVLIGGMSLIIAVSFVTALFCYLGLSNEANLPNATTFLTGVFAILVPLALQFIFQRALGGDRDTQDRDAGRPVNPFTGQSLPPPPPPPPPPQTPRPFERSLNRRR